MRSQFPLLVLLAVLSVAPIMAQPVVNAIENNYSYIFPGLPNYGIAQGSIFVIFGSNLATAASGLQNAPLHTTLNGVSVQFSVGGATTQALMYYVLPNQIAGILPSNTPIGTGEFTVTSNGMTSPTGAITVVRSAFGILTSNTGRWSAAAFDANGKPLNATNAANPGDTIVIYGSGAGPVTGDESVLQTQRNLDGVPIEVDIGEIPAAVQYHGRSIYPGLDQINVAAPRGVAGCNVSLAVVSSGLVSNIAFVPIAAQSRTCSDQIPGVSVPSQSTLNGRTAYTVGTIGVTRSVNVIPPVAFQGMTEPAVNYTLDNATGLFERMTFSQPTSVGIGGSGNTFPSIGNCFVSTIQIPLPLTPGSGSANPPFSYLNAGASINFIGPNGNAAVKPQTNGLYAGVIGGGTVQNPLPLFIPAGGGAIRIDNGSGGPDLGAFSAQFNVSPPLVWSNMSAIPGAIDRTKAVTVTWTGGNPSGLVSILAMSTISTSADRIIAQVNCTAPVSSGQFTIPSSALLALPQSSLTVSGTVLLNTSLSLETSDQFLFSAPGLDAGIVNLVSQNNLTVPYQ